MARAGEIPSVKESVVKACYGCSCTSFTLLLIFLSVKFGFGFYDPTFSIDFFFVPALNKTSSDTRNSSIFFDLKLQNNNYEKEIYYDALNVTLYYGQYSSFPVGNVSIPGFYEDYDRFQKTHRKEMVTATGAPWETDSQEVSNGTNVFWVDLKTAVRYGDLFWKTKRYSIKVGGSVRVNDQGSMVKHKNTGVKLSSASVQAGHSTHVYWLVGFVFLFLWS